MRPVWFASMSAFFGITTPGSRISTVASTRSSLGLTPTTWPTGTPRTRTGVPMCMPHATGNPTVNCQAEMRRPTFIECTHFSISPVNAARRRRAPGQPQPPRNTARVGGRGGLGAGKKRRTEADEDEEPDAALLDGPPAEPEVPDGPR